MLDAWFERPDWLWLLPAAGLVLGLLDVRGRWCLRERMDRLGVSYHARRLGRTLLTATALTLVTVAAAGPRWGPPTTADVATGRDIAIVIDASRSMTASDVHPDRLGRALALAGNLVAQSRRRGGDRLAVVVFASQPYRLVPLTFDLDHVASALADVRADRADWRAPAAASGTRIGAAVRHAVLALQAGHAPDRNILVLSDGDDPAGDGEWQKGAEAAAAARIPVHVIGLGSATRAAAIPGLVVDGQAITTRQQAGPLRELAVRTGGRFIADSESDVDWPDLLQHGSPRSATETAVARPPARPISFLAAGLGATVLALLGRPQRRVLVAGSAAVLLAAGPVDEWVSRGNAALQAGRPDDALGWYARAAVRTPDPGAVAFNQGVALAALGQYRDAELHFRRALSDALSRRRAQALYNLGTCQVRRGAGRDRRGLTDAIAAFRLAGELLADDDPLRADVRHNQALAEAMLQIAPADRPADDPTEPDDLPNPAAPTAPADPPLADHSRRGTTASPRPAGAAPNTHEAQPTDQPGPPGAGNLPPLPDSDVVERIAPEDLAGHLNRAVDRISRAQHERLRSRGPAGRVDFPDW